MLLQVLLTHVPPEELLQYQGARAHLEALIPYTGQPRRPGAAAVPVPVCTLTASLLCHREAHAEDRPPPAGVHVFELLVAEDESGGGTVKVRQPTRRSSPPPQLVLEYLPLSNLYDPQSLWELDLDNKMWSIRSHCVDANGMVVFFFFTR